MSRRRPSCAIALLGALAAAAALRASPVISRPAEEPPEEKALRQSVRDLPALLERWRCKCRPLSVVVDRGVVYVLTPSRLLALDAEDGAVLWDSGREEDPAAPGTRLVVSDDRVAAAFGSEVVLRDRATGAEIARIDVGGRVEELVGPPLVVSRRLPEGRGSEEVLRLDPASGQVLARAAFAAYPRLLAHAGVAYLTRFEGDAPVLARLAAATLAVEQEWGAPSAEIHPRADGRLVAVERELDGVVLHALDPASGEWSPQRLRSDLRLLGTFVDLRLAAVAHRGRGEARGLAAFDDTATAPRWTTTLPCSPGPPLEERGRLLVPCSWQTSAAGVLLVLDPASGEVAETLAAPGRVRALHAAGDALVLVTDDGVVAVDPDVRAAPLGQREPPAASVDRILAGIGDRLPLVEPDAREALVLLGKTAAPALLERLTAGAPSLPAALTLAAALGELRHEPAAPAVAALLRSLPPLAERQPWPTEARSFPPELSLLGALAAIAGPEEVPSVGQVLLDALQPPRVRAEAAHALAAIGHPTVLRWIDDFARQQAAETGEAAAAGERQPSGRQLSPESQLHGAILQHVRWFGDRGGPLRVCAVDSALGDVPGAASPGDSATPPPRTAAESCIPVSIEELDDVPGAREIADALPLEDGERQLVLSIRRDSGWQQRRVYRLTRVGDRWLVRSVWHWVS